jgi:hypothetical protein
MDRRAPIVEAATFGIAGCRNNQRRAAETVTTNDGELSSGR